MSPHTPREHQQIAAVLFDGDFVTLHRCDPGQRKWNCVSNRTKFARIRTAPPSYNDAMDYEFRFFRGPGFDAIHMTSVESDADALERARIYLRQNQSFSHVEVRRGMSFIRRLENDSLPGEAPLF